MPSTCQAVGQKSPREVKADKTGNAGDENGRRHPSISSFSLQAARVQSGSRPQPQDRARFVQ